MIAKKENKVDRTKMLHICIEFYILEDIIQQIDKNDPRICIFNLTTYHTHSYQYTLSIN
jgi:hypothetical protein